MGSPAFKPPDADALTAAVRAGVAAPVDEELWERRMKALTLRNAGGTFTQIAAQLGISATVCRADVRIALREVLAETLEDGIARQVSVLRDMQRGAYPGALAGDKDSIMSIVRCLEQEAKLKGFYAPARLAVGISDVDFAEQAAELITKLGLTPPKELMVHGRGDARAGESVAHLGQPAAGGHGGPVDVGEVIDGIVERFVTRADQGEVVPGFDIPAYDLPVEHNEPLGVTISDDAIGAAAAAAIDPEQFGDGDDGAVSDQRGDVGGWSNL